MPRASSATSRTCRVDVVDFEVAPVIASADVAAARRAAE
jgi:hypothetical protein